MKIENKLVIMKTVLTGCEDLLFVGLHVKADFVTCV